MEPLRECKCGLQAFTEEDLELFIKSKHCKYNRSNICRSCESARSKQYYQDNRKIILERQLGYYVNNSKAIKEYQLSFRQNNKELFKIRDKGYRKKYTSTLKGKITNLTKNAKRRALKLQQTPNLTGADTVAIKIIYTLARATNKHVDHIIPLAKGGLHHPMNLQVLSAKDNLEKSDSVIKEIPIEILNLHRGFYLNHLWLPN